VTPPIALLLLAAGFAAGLSGTVAGLAWLFCPHDAPRTNS
jgi:hypothetical protein